jgi:hypothetical protein
MFPHRKIHNYTPTSQDGETHNQIVHILIDRVGIGVYSMYGLLGELTGILITDW